jgi:hypothetical protein
MTLVWEQEGNAYTARGRHHRYEISFDDVGRACLTQSSTKGGVSPVVRTTSGFVAAIRMQGLAQVWESEATPFPVVSQRREPKRWTDKVFSWAPFG